MSHKQKAREDERIISETVAAEESAALARFRASDFEGSVRRRLARSGAVEARRPLFPSITPAGWGAIAGGLAACALIAALLLPPPAELADIGDQIARCLETNPGVLSQGWEAGPSTGTDPAVEPSRLSSILTGLMGDRSPDPGAPAAPAPRRSFGRPLSLEEMFKILVIDRSVERALALVS
jgi:hypothetical protein